MHRDLKPENLVFDSDGYIRLTDFGIASIDKEEGISEGSGTPGYMAPEVMCRLKHGKTVDYYAIGVMVYEMMFRRRPYSGADKN